MSDILPVSPDTLLALRQALVTERAVADLIQQAVVENRPEPPVVQAAPVAGRGGVVDTSA